LTPRAWLLQATVAGAVLGAGPAMASGPRAKHDHSPRAVSIQAEAGVVSDYRFRGVSLSGEDAALQGGVELSSEAATLGVWTSTIARTAGGSRQEVDLYATLSEEIGQVEVSASALAYIYPGDPDANYVELGAGISRQLGPIELALGLAYAPEQENLGDADNVYASLSGSMPTPLADLSVSVGHESGAFAPGGKWDWLVAVARRLGPVEVSLSYVDSDQSYRDGRERNLSDGTIMAGLKIVLGSARARLTSGVQTALMNSEESAQP
jgi:uncharacterized protein (TIGR02001 family)